MTDAPGTPPPTLDIDELLTCTPTVRRRLDLSRPVSRPLLTECLQLALHAPNGGNRQNWRFLVIDDPETKAGIARHYKSASDNYLAATPPSAMSEKAVAGVRYLADHLHEVPALVLACVHGRLPADAPLARQSGFFGTIYPALWSFMLAARSRGLGTALTTVHLAHEREVAALVGLPADEFTQVALVAVGHVTGGPGFRRTRRKPLDDVMSWNRWDS
ncbi:nitroreductase [Streptomyces sp. 2333.5]|uniref:nitroreductase family protein n=1 Tax=unclassified Streptomyces TaxID=2593676 RepID=UPI0008973779|nr:MULTISPECIES: nitroreductase family protein [unclassified Streptomyces]PJJ06481.1 nitroreductase [Streptomyces sp. 2333.5]SEE95928.1 Nitroreductase [Streptomyces sp. 2314.4]SEF10320.1 Nitroreductase [Streptomyces sp. 2112.2]